MRFAYFIFLFGITLFAQENSLEERVQKLESRQTLLETENQELKKAIRELSIAKDFPLEDLKDIVSLQYRDTVTDLERSKVESEGRRVWLERIEKIKEPDVIARNAVYTKRMEWSRGEHETRSLQHRAKAFEFKIAALEALIGQDNARYNQLHHQANQELLSEFKSDRKKTLVEYHYWKHQLAQMAIQTTDKGEPISWIRFHEVKTNLARTEAELIGISGKIKEQEQHFLMTREALKRSTP